MRYSHSLRKYMQDGEYSSAGKQMLLNHVKRTHGNQEVTFIGNRVIIGEGNVISYNELLNQAVSAQKMINDPELNHITEQSMGEVGRRSDRVAHAVNDKTEFYSHETNSVADAAYTSMLNQAGK